MACSGSSSTKVPEPPSPPPADAAVDAPPDAGVDPALAAAPAFVFRFASPDRVETWTVQHLDTRGLVRIEREKPAATQNLYLGSATDDGKTITLEVVDRGAKLSLACTRDKLDVAAANANGCVKGKWVQPKTTKRDVLGCKHPDFEAPMPFAAAPGLEYVVVDDGACKGSVYRMR